MISPILTYNSEVWGVYTKPDFKTWESTQIEKTHLKFCKRYLKVSNKACNVACRADLGRFPLRIAINRKILNYILYLLSKDDDSVVKQFFLMSLDLYSSGKSSFYSNLVRISEFYNQPNFDPLLVTGAKINHYLKLMQQQYILH